MSASCVPTARPELLNDAVRMNPAFLPAQEQLGIVMLRRGNLAGAEELAGKIQASDPQAVEGHRLMAFVLWKKKDLDSSLAECALVLGISPDDLAVMSLEALELWQLNRKKESRQVLTRVAQANMQLKNSALFCRLLYCSASDIAPVEEFLKKNRGIFMPPMQP